MFLCWISPRWIKTGSKTLHAQNNSHAGWLGICKENFKNAASNAAWKIG